MREVAAGLMQPWEFRRKWYGEDEGAARAALAAGPGPGGAGGR